MQSTVSHRSTHSDCPGPAAAAAGMANYVNIVRADKEDQDTSGVHINCDYVFSMLFA